MDSMVPNMIREQTDTLSLSRFSSLNVTDSHIPVMHYFYCSSVHVPLSSYAGNNTHVSITFVKGCAQKTS